MLWLPLHTRCCGMAQSRHRCAHLLSKRMSSGTDTSHDTQVKTSPKMTEQGTPKLTLQKRQQTSTKNCQNQLLHNNWTTECHQELTSKGTLHEEATALHRGHRGGVSYLPTAPTPLQRATRIPHTSCWCHKERYSQRPAVVLLTRVLGK